MGANAVDIGTMIESTPGYVGGRPRIAGTRLPVATIAALWQEGHTAEAIVDRVFPHLTLAQVHAALAYYFANQAAVDRRALEDALFGCEAEAAHLRAGNSEWMGPEEREKRLADLAREETLLRSRLG